MTLKEVTIHNKNHKMKKRDSHFNKLSDKNKYEKNQFSLL